MTSQSMKPSRLYTNLLRWALTISLVAFSINAFGAGADGLFGDYFTRMTGICPSNQVLVGFSTGSTEPYGTKICVPAAVTSPSTPASTLAFYGSETTDEGKAVVGFDLLGNIIFSEIGPWKKSGPNISYTGGNVGIGTSSPTEKLEIDGNLSASGTISIKNGTTFMNTWGISTNGGIWATGEITGSRFIGHGGGNITTNSAIGSGSLASNTTGFNNTANGVNALAANTQGFGNTANGKNALATNSTGSFNTANGGGSLRYNRDGINNTANGFSALSFNTNGSDNTANGVNSLFANTTGIGNTADGYSALYTNATGHWNTAVGNFALGNVNGENNTALGSNAAAALTVGQNNIAIGYSAGSNISSGDNNIVIGSYAQIPNGDNQLKIGDWIYGSGGKIGIGTLTPTQKLDVNGNMNVSGAVVIKTLKATSGKNLGSLPLGWSGGIQSFDIYSTSGSIAVGDGSSNGANAIRTLMNTSGISTMGGIWADGNVNANGFIYNSDRNLKKNIVPLSDSLQKILALNGYSFNWKSTGVKDIGVIAQEVEAVYPELVHTNEKGIKSVEYGNLIAPLIESIKTQQQEIDELKIEIQLLKQSK